MPSNQMLAAFALGLGQLTDPRVLRLLARSVAISLVLCGLIGWDVWVGADRALLLAGLDARMLPGGEDLRGLLDLALAVVALWLLWRIVALMVLEFHGDAVVAAIEARSYPAAAATARALGWRAELGLALAAAGRALIGNLVALPLALVLAPTGIGAPLVLIGVNAVLLGRELQDMVWLRHRPSPDAPAPLNLFERLALGAIVATMLAVPFVNLIAPFLGAASVTHLIHRKGVIT